MKLHFKHQNRSKHFLIRAASIKTYLLERSRITLHDKGERNYNTFYQLLAARGQDFYLNKPKSIGFRNLSNLNSVTQISCTMQETKCEILSNDKELYSALEKSMYDMGLSEDIIVQVFSIVSAILHLGNIGFEDKETLEGDCAQYVLIEEGYDPLDCAAKLLSVDMKKLEDLLLIRTIYLREDLIEVHRDTYSASFIRDAIAKMLYNLVFDQIIKLINSTLDKNK